MGKSKKNRIVIDTNVIVSALLFGGIPGELVSLWKTGLINPLISRDIIDEYMQVLTYPKFKLTEKELNFILYHEILPYFEVITIIIPEQNHIIIQEDPSDDKFILCAQSGKANVIISGDHHLLDLKSHGKIKILTPFQFLNALAAKAPFPFSA